METPSTAQLLEELKGGKCRCGKPKISYRTFCGYCFRQLPQDKQKALYRRFGHGYESAYADAVGFLAAAGIIVLAESASPGI
jgi:hypothetical protein